jgi:hypothetical protein
MHVYHSTYVRKTIIKYKNKIVTNVTFRTSWYGFTDHLKKGENKYSWFQTSHRLCRFINYRHIRSCDNNEQNLLLQGFGFLSCSCLGVGTIIFFFGVDFDNLLINALYMSPNVQCCTFAVSIK